MWAPNLLAVAAALMAIALDWTRRLLSHRNAISTPLLLASLHRTELLRAPIQTFVLAMSDPSLSEVSELIPWRGTKECDRHGIISIAAGDWTVARPVPILANNEKEHCGCPLTEKPPMRSQS